MMPTNIDRTASANRPFALLFLLGLAGCAAGEFGELANTVSHDPEPKPVILLTGFEPFGEGRPSNPSWEGVSGLDGKDWTNFRIVAHQLPVVWGEPMKHLEELINEHHPVAVFSFGQGGTGAFAIESRAVNLRAEIRDNAGSFPTEEKITPDGPETLSSSFACQAVADALTQKGYPVRVSQSAGQYLCEETLYSLEYIRSTKQRELTVAFCHVPPLGTPIGKEEGKTVDKEYVQQFVLDYLGAWQAVSATQKPTPAATSKETPSATSHPEYPSVSKLIDSYFKSWSDQRMKDYGACFGKNAVIQEISSDGDINTSMKDPFVSTQSTYHKFALFKAIEVPVKTDITFEADLARAVVYWKLTAGPRTQFGYDHFTLIKQNGQWKIVNLVFYATKDPAE